jgi:hypothetical protein
MGQVRKQRDDATPLQKKSSYYSRRKDKENPYDKLSDQEKEIFELLYTRHKHNLSAVDIAKNLGISKTVVSEFYNSPEYEEVAALRAYRDHRGLLPLAISTQEDILRNSKSDTARNAVAKEIIDRVGPLMDAESGLGAKTVNIFNTIVNNGEELTLESIRRRKIETQRRLETELESSGNSKTR